MDKTTGKIKKRYDRAARIYDLLEKPMDTMMRKYLWDSLFNDLEGKVLEVGVGTGKNIGKYNSETEVTAIDLSYNMLKRAKEKALKLGIRNVEFKQMDIQNMDFEDNYFDYVIATCVFCSVPDPIKGLKEIKRVLKPKGKAIFVEHVRSKNRVIGKLMDVFNPIPLNLYGANINRKTVENIRSAGFKNIEVSNLWLDINEPPPLIQ